jgi:lipoic acid synthetase/lipoate-protein ligase A
MIYVQLPHNFNEEAQKLPFFLAMEEYIARNFSGDYFFMWQVDPTVIFGRNQLIDAELNLDYCRAEGIQTYRRKSGGGCVFADRNNIMFSHITTSNSVATTFTAFTQAVANMLCQLGLDASTTGRNDILIDDQKVSGYAFYHINLPAGSRAIVHGTMLYDADVDKMTAALTPSTAKLQAKGVASVRKRITTIRQHSSIGIEQFKAFARKTLCDSNITLSDNDIAHIREIEQNYYTDSWTFHRRKQHDTPPTPQRIEGVGEFVVELRTTPTGNSTPPTITALDLCGDFFITGDIDAALIQPLIGCPLTHTDMARALANVNVENVVPNLTKNAFINLILNAIKL